MNNGVVSILRSSHQPNSNDTNVVPAISMPRLRESVCTATTDTFVCSSLPLAHEACEPLNKLGVGHVVDQIRLVNLCVLST